MLNTSQGVFTRYWDDVNTMLEMQLGAIKISFKKSVAIIEHQYNTQFYSTLHDFVSWQCIQHIKKELERVKRVGTDKFEHGYFIRTTHGLPCACELAGLLIQGYHAPLESIHLVFEEITHWRAWSHWRREWDTFRVRRRMWRVKEVF